MLDDVIIKHYGDIRVFPGEGITAPRFPLLKSYSLRIILLCLAVACLSRRNNSNPAVTRRMNYNQHTTAGIHADGNESSLIYCVRVFNCESPGITKCLLCVCETNAMLAQICARLHRIELNYYITSMHILCIFSTERETCDRLGMVILEPSSETADRLETAVCSVNPLVFFGGN